MKGASADKILPVHGDSGSGRSELWLELSHERNESSRFKRDLTVCLRDRCGDCDGLESRCIGNTSTELGVAKGYDTRCLIVIMNCRPMVEVSPEHVY